MDNIFQAIALGGKAPKGLEEAVDLIQATAAFSDIPDTAEVRAALDVWGVAWAEGGEPIQQMFSSKKCLRATLPPVWRVTHERGHFGLVDGNGAERLHWYVHGWDPVDVQVRSRFRIYTDRTGARTGVMQALDGIRVIHAIPMRFDVARVQQESGYWAAPEDEGQFKALVINEETVTEAARASVRAWLNAHVPGWDAWGPEVWNLEY